MRTWNLKAGDPLSLTIAADVRLSAPTYRDDQIWELSLGNGVPPALALQTTYGLRARSMRLFPRFTEGENLRTDPADFASPPIVRNFSPNFLRIAFSPLPEIEITAEYWVPQSQVVAGRLRFVNRSRSRRSLHLDWVALLAPQEQSDGHGMAPMEIQVTSVLAGKSGDLTPVVFLTGGATTTNSPYPALMLDFDLPPGGSHDFIWSAAALSTPQASFDLARQTASCQWEAELARLEMVNASQIEIYTGDPDWDVAFALAQKIALGSFVAPTTHLPYPSFVQSRRPNRGFSPRGDGSDYDHLWNGQTPLETYLLTGLILPSALHLGKGLLRNFLATQTYDGAIDGKPGLGGQRANQLATPILSSLAWRIYQASEDRPFLEENYPSLLAYLQTWFTLPHDRDGDGIPEWDHLMQAGLDEHPLFAHWQEWAQGIDITTVESPSLCAFLYRECQSLIAIAQLLDRSADIPPLRTIAERLRAALEASWDAQSAAYRYWDRDTHLSPCGSILGSWQEPGNYPIEKSFEQPTRLVVQLRAEGAVPRRLQVFIHGRTAAGARCIEHFLPDQFRWFFGRSTVTSERAYAAIESFDVIDIGDTDQVTLLNTDLTCDDLTLLLPLWGQVPSPEQAESLLAHAITQPHRYSQPFGLPLCPLPSCQAQPCAMVHILWNTLIGEGLVAYGYRKEAAELVGRLMKAVVQSLKSERAFRQGYHAESGEGFGERDVLPGLAPLSLFLEVLGVRLISPYRLRLEGFNPFPWPVTVKDRGLSVVRQKDKTLIIFPDGQTIQVNDPTPCIVSCEEKISYENQ